MDTEKRKLLEQLSKLGDVVYIKGTRKRNIINAFKKMDLSLLEALLDNDRTYSDLTKESFLLKIKFLFKQFKDSNDTKLILSRGECISDSCNNQGCKGYTFIGNNSKNYIDLIINETVNDIIDIYFCGDFSSNNPNFILNDRFTIRVYLDEKAGFNPSAERRIIFKACAESYRNIIDNEKPVLSKLEIVSWLTDNRDLYNTIHGDFDYLPFLYKSIDQFENLYRILLDFETYIRFEHELATAVEHFKNIKFSNDIEVLKWLLSYEELSANLEYINAFHHFDKNPFLELSKDSDRKIYIEEYKNVIFFLDNYYEYYRSMFKKYSTISTKDLDKIKYDTPEYKENSSLKYHLTKRGIAIN